SENSPTVYSNEVRVISASASGLVTTAAPVFSLDCLLHSVVRSTQRHVVGAKGHRDGTDPTRVERGGAGGLEGLVGARAGHGSAGQRRPGGTRAAVGLHDRPDPFATAPVQGIRGERDRRPGAHLSRIGDA